MPFYLCHCLRGRVELCPTINPKGIYECGRVGKSQITDRAATGPYLGYKRYGCKLMWKHDHHLNSVKTRFENIYFATE